MTQDIYIHRSGRTARIGNEGTTLTLIAPAEERTFKILCKDLKKSGDKMELLKPSYTQLKKLEPYIETAKQLEKAAH